MVVADGEAASDVLAEGAEVTPHSLADRLERLEAGGVAGGMEADAFGGAVVDATKTATCPSPVIVVVRSVPHIVSTVSGMIVPSWLRGPRGGPMREGASRPFSRISRRTRRSEVRIPARRSRAQTFRCPSP